MTDLERARGVFSEYEPTPGDLLRFDRAIEAHLKVKEDAERERSFENLDRSESEWRDLYFDCRDQLAELNRMLSEAGAHDDAHHAELARLREDKDASDKGYMNEIVRLREDYAVLNQEADALSEKVVTLLAALREIGKPTTWQNPAAVEQVLRNKEKKARAAIAEVEGEK